VRSCNMLISLRSVHDTTKCDRASAVPTHVHWYRVTHTETPRDRLAGCAARKRASGDHHVYAARCTVSLSQQQQRTHGPRPALQRAPSSAPKRASSRQLEVRRHWFRRRLDREWRRRRGCLPVPCISAASNLAHAMCTERHAIHHAHKNPEPPDRRAQLISVRAEAANLHERRPAPRTRAAPANAYARRRSTGRGGRTSLLGWGPAQLADAPKIDEPIVQQRAHRRRRRE